MLKANKTLEMTVFVAIMDSGSLVGAAERLNLSKQAISRHLNALEQRLNLRLLHRTTRRLSPTEDGRLFYEQAKTILAAIEEAEASLVEGQTNFSGKIYVNVPVSFGVLHLAPLWEGFLAAYPKVTLDIALNDRIVDLVEEGFDLAIRIAELPNSTLVTRKLATTKVLLCASPDYLDAYGTPQTAQDLNQHRTLSYSNWSDKETWVFKENGHKSAFNLRSVLHTNNGDTCRMLALQGAGITLQPDFLIGDDVAEGRLVHVLPQLEFKDLGIYAVYPSRKLVSSRVRSLVDYLTVAFKQPLWTQNL
ncbi:MAG: LysR family transcriptional regulator [Neisseriaceae bacterium]|nr:LysR family transcriptional regulator [Neisseriaceae bacterium]MBP6863613.1 LysR family transcriptional regulator [Neisseriaceae bacterium]